VPVEGMRTSVAASGRVAVAVSALTESYAPRRACGLSGMRRVASDGHRPRTSLGGLTPCGFATRPGNGHEHPGVSV
jgi:hypothetical protein